MARVLHLFNILGAPTEAMWLEYTTLLAQLGHEVICGYETLGEYGQATLLPKVKLPRINVEQASDVESQFACLTEPHATLEIEQLLNQDFRRVFDLVRGFDLIRGFDSLRGFDLVHGHGGTRILHGAPWLARGVPMVVSLYGYDCSRLLRDPCWVDRYKWAAERGAVFVVLHESMRIHLETLGIPNSSIREIPLGIKLQEWPYDLDAIHDPAQPRFVFVGRLVPKKQPIVLLHALAALRDRSRIHARLDIVGDGPLRPEIESVIDELGLSLQVQLHGSLHREKITSLLRAATCLVLPSTRAADGDCEGTPIVLMESQALGVPCMTTNHAGNADVLAPAMRSFVIEHAEPQLLAASMAKLIRLSPAEILSLREAGRAWVESQFDIAQTAAAYSDLYNILQPPPHPRGVG